MRSRAGAITPLGRRSNELAERTIKVKDDYYVFTSACETKKEDSRNLWKKKVLVDVRGFEPLTPCLQSRCSPS